MRLYFVHKKKQKGGNMHDKYFAAREERLKYDYVVVEMEKDEEIREIARYSYRHESAARELKKLVEEDQDTKAQEFTFRRIDIVRKPKI